MSQDSLLPTFDELKKALQKENANTNPAEVHGLLCGLICATPDELDNDWQRLLVNTDPNPKTQEILQRLYELSDHEMSEFSFEFSLVLPKDSADINVRTEALGLWCQGFLTGLNKAQEILQQNATPEITEALNDLVEISQVNYGDIQSDDEDETAYFELVEYVRLIALMIYHELKTDSPDDDLASEEYDDDTNNIMH